MNVEIVPKTIGAPSMQGVAWQISGLLYGGTFQDCDQDGSPLVMTRTATTAINQSFTVTPGDWQVTSTQLFDVNGNFINTNAVTPGARQM